MKTKSTEYELIYDNERFRMATGELFSVLWQMENSEYLEN